MLFLFHRKDLVFGKSKTSTHLCVNQSVRCSTSVEADRRDEISRFSHWMPSWRNQHRRGTSAVRRRTFSTFSCLTNRNKTSKSDVVAQTIFLSSFFSDALLKRNSTYKMYRTYAIEERQRERKEERVKKLSGPVFFSLSLSTLWPLGITMQKCSSISIK